jgi:hypothetical protein
MNKILVFLIIVLLIIGTSLLIPQVQRGIVKLVVVTGRLEIAAAAPQVLYVYMNDVQLPSSTTQLTGSHVFNGQEDSTYTHNQSYCVR